MLFAAIYRLVRDHRVVAARGFHRLWYRLRWLNTGHYKRFGPWLDGLVRSGALIIDGTSTESLRQAIRQHRIDLLLVHGWDVLPMEVLQDAPYGAVNVHPSCLPKYKGALPTLWALKNGDRSSCVTIQRIGSNVDGGDIIAQHPFGIGPHDTSLDVQRTVDDVTKAHLFRDVLGYLNGAIAPHAQSDVASWTARYESYRRIRWGKECARDVVNKVLLYPFLVPKTYCYCMFRGRRAGIRGARQVPSSFSPAPGEYQVTWTSLVVGCKEGSVALRLFRDLGARQSLMLLLQPRGRLH